MKNIKKSLGFTLVELLVVVAIMGLISIVLVNITTQTYRGENKTKVLAEVQQNGRTVLDRITKAIREADSIVCVGDTNFDDPATPDIKPSTFDTLVLSKSNWTNGSTRFQYDTEQGTNNGYITIDHPNIITDPSSTCLSMAPETDEYQILTSNSPLNPAIGVSIRPGLADLEIFSRNSSGTSDSDNVEINFYATTGVGAGSLYETSLPADGYQFKTTAKVRSVN